MSRFLIVDTSYAVFFRYFATKVWNNLAHPEDKFEEDYDWFQNEIFLKSFIDPNCRHLTISLTNLSE